MEIISEMRYTLKTDEKEWDQLIDVLASSPSQFSINFLGELKKHREKIGEYYGPSKKDVRADV